MSEIYELKDTEQKTRYFLKETDIELLQSWLRAGLLIVKGNSEAEDIYKKYRDKDINEVKKEENGEQKKKKKKK